MESNASRAASLLAGRFRIEAELGRGGMACVYRAHDERSGQRVALKKLTATGDRSASLRAMFEREFHTLAQLEHPHIVRVFDYGLDGDDPYYTMELLEGSDTQAALLQSSLSVREICSLLRDGASALTLIHSRRLVHRDVGPRNLWRMPDGRAKLIDFGTLVAMGSQSDIAGTPPFVAPEALYMQPLDARCDLYALGALAYVLLTRRNAYPARDLRDLREHWQRKPTPPDALNPDVPSTLAELVMALLSLDARARPTTASEVYDRLSAIGNLPIEDQRNTAQAFLNSPMLVGRSEASREIAKHLHDLLAGRGGVVSIVSPSGFGRTRMCANAVLQANIAGAATIRIDSTAVASTGLASAGALAEQLIAALPILPAHAIELGPLLGHLSPVLYTGFGSQALLPLSGIERNEKLSAALVKLFQRASEQSRVVIAVDNIHRADAASLRVLARVALLTAERPLLVITTCESRALAQQPLPALEQLVPISPRIELAALTSEQTHELLESLFGAIGGLEDASAWIHELTAGSPQACMQYAQYLVDKDIARYQRGQWVLPLRLREQGLPNSFEAMLDQRIEGLSEDARSLALGLALARDESRSSWQPEQHVRLEDFPKLLNGGDVARSSAALDELLAGGIVQQRDSYYLLAQRSMVDALIRTAALEARRDAHARLAQIFTGEGYRSSWVVIRQLLSAGDHVGARREILRFAELAASRPVDWGAMRVSLHAQCSREAVDHWQREGGSPREGVILRRVLLTAATVYDWRLARYGDAQLAQLLADCGWHYRSEVDSALPELDRTHECLNRAQQHYESTPDAERGFAPIDALHELCMAASALTRAYVSSYDVERARSLSVTLSTLGPLSPTFTLFTDLCLFGVTRATGGEPGDVIMDITMRVMQLTELPEMVRLGSAALALHEQALDDARMGRRRGLQLLDLIAAGGTFDDLFVVLHGRWIMHAFLGDAETARGLRKRAEIITEDDVWRQKAYLFIEAEYYALIGDLHALTRIEVSVAELAQMFDGWVPWLSYTRASMARLRGDLSAAKSELEIGLASARPGEHRAWVALAPTYAEVLLLLGDDVAAELAAQNILALAAERSLLNSCALAGKRILALALSAQQRHAAAKELIASAIADALRHEAGGLPLAKLYESSAQIALSAGDSREWSAALAALGPLIDRSEASALLAAREALLAACARRSEDRSRTRVSPSGAADGTATILYDDVRTLLATVHQGEERAIEALKLILTDTGAPAGHLLLVDEDGLFAACCINDRPANDQLVRVAQLHLDGRRRSDTMVTQSEIDAEPTAFEHGDWQLTAVPLTYRNDETCSVAGLIMLAKTDNEVRPPRLELLQVISQCLLAAGDTIVLFDEI